jgi:hypothetical protein
MGLDWSLTLPLPASSEIPPIDQRMRVSDIWSMPKKEIRFGDLVKASGKPTIVSLWTNPRRDRPFMRAVKENRVLTLMQEPASRTKDFGRIGFHQNQHASYLVFPEPLPANRESRVIGIKYDLVEQPRIKDPVSRNHLESKPTKPRRQALQKVFNVVIRRVAKIETSVAVTARSEAVARDRAVQSAKRQGFDPAKAVIHDEVVSVE